MASITITGVYLAPVDSPSSLLKLNAGVSLASAGGVRGEFRVYAGGRVRLINQAGLANTVSVEVTHADRTTRELLASWAGELLLLRDGRGRLMTGSFLVAEADEQQGLPYADLSFEFTEITTTLEV